MRRLVQGRPRYPGSSALLGLTRAVVPIPSLTRSWRRRLDVDDSRHSRQAYHIRHSSLGFHDRCQPHPGAGLHAVTSAVFIWTVFARLYVICHSGMKKAMAPALFQAAASMASIPSVHIVNSAHSLNGTHTLNANETIRLAEQTAARLLTVPLALAGLLSPSLGAYKAPL
jgi:hypothetical protein